MKKKTIQFGVGFHVVLGNRRSQAAAMVLKPGDSEGGPTNRHRGADQWLFVVSGTGVARLNGKAVALKERVLLLIAHNDRHEIKNTGKTLLKTLNFYSPPAYTPGGDELAAGKPGDG